MFAAETFRLHVIERPDPAEVLGWIGEGLVRLRLPLPRRRISVGPIALSIDSTAVLEVPVHEGRIDRSRVRGHLEPPVRLPLGFDIDRIRVSAQGDVVLGLRGLPDLNLSPLLAWLPRVPTTLRELGEQLTGRESRVPETGAPSPSSQRPGAPVEAAGRPADARSAGLEVQALRVRPLPGVVVDLGPAGRLELGEESELDVGYARGRLTCHGRLVLEGGELRGPAFEVEGLRSDGQIRWERKIRLDLSDVVAHADRLQWSHDHAWHLVDVQLTSPSIRYATLEDDFSLEGEIDLEGSARPGLGPPDADSAPVQIRVHLRDDAIETIDRPGADGRPGADEA